ncbi:monocarboxylate transporter 14-like isoform X2 [Cimex lectularius]|nr:monocarboxylate transporter 14-like isoform X2 [Cimex lectularius]
MTIVGGCVSCAGFVASAFSTSIVTMYCTFGIISGLGLGLCYVTAVVSIAYWFDKKRTLATSLGASGTGIGTFVYAPLTRLAISYYGWRGTVLLLAGTFLNMCVCGALMRDPDWWIEAQKSSRASSLCHDLDELKRMLEAGTMSNDYVRPPLTPIAEQSYHSLVNIPTFVESTDKVPPELVEHLLGKEQALRLANPGRILEERDKTKSKSLSGRLNSMSEGDANSPKSGREMTDVPEVIVDHFKTANSRSHVTRPWAHRLRNIRVHRNSVMYRGAILNMHKYRLTVSSCPDIFKNSMTTIAKEGAETWKDELVDLLEGMTDFSMFGDLHFLLMSLSTTLLFIWFIVPYFYLADYMTTLGYTEEKGSFILAAIGIANTFGMVIMGWVGDKPWLNVTKTYAGCLILTGLFTLIMPLVSGNMVTLTLASVGFGMFVSSNFSFTPTILVELIALDRFTTAYGLTLLCQGIGTLIGPPLAGWIFDLTQSWDLSFYMAGGWIVIAGVLMAVIPAVKTVRLWGSESQSESQSRSVTT